MTISPIAGMPAPSDLLVDVPTLISAYYTEHPDPGDQAQQVSFGTSGHRGTSLDCSFNEDHILAISQAIVEYRASQGTTGPLYFGKDTHALSEPALRTAMEVFAANGVMVMLQEGLGYTPTPVISRAILTYNRARPKGKADGVVITPSHNPPKDGGFKYNPPHGGPAATETTRTIQDRANEILRAGLKAVKRVRWEKAIQTDTTQFFDFVRPYVDDLKNVLNMGAIAASGIRIGVDPLGGAGVHYWEPIAATYGLDLEVVNKSVDPTFRFMTVDHDGEIRMDPSSKYAMASLIDLQDKFDIAFGNDTDYDRHGIVTPTAGLMNPNHFLAAAVWYLFGSRHEWLPDATVGKTVVTSGILDRVARSLDRGITEVPVGFKWFVPGLLHGDVGIGGEESAGASFLRKDGTTWTTDKDGIIMDLLAAEILAVTGKDPAEHYAKLEEEFGKSYYGRIEAPATLEQKAVFKALTPEMVRADTLAGEEIEKKLTRAPGNDAPIGGLKIVTENGWTAVRPSGTEDIYKVYAESFNSETHLQAILDEGQAIVQDLFKQEL
ncbi:MAG: phosphoglucomutase (alpha-D-glucose-1,6-bisphosphate-dependent) [Chloroflexota bacterium]|nr:phosphoglucomutase (alpha-D-glucose-1,6-bisphosphate-dependent) [Chloroflexota bacterium]